LELTGKLKPHICADDVNILAGNTNTTKKNREALLKASREVSLEVNTEKTKYMVVSRKGNIG
jgi:hypothetical protein